MGKRKVPMAALELVGVAARRIRELEASASRALHEAGDTATHRAELTQKCLVLEALSEDVADLLADGPDSPSGDVAAFVAGLEDFSKRAAMALSLESIFFMGALLYPDDYHDGEPNDLERFLDWFEGV